MWYIYMAAEKLTETGHSQPCPAAIYSFSRYKPLWCALTVVCNDCHSRQERRGGTISKLGVLVAALLNCC